MRAHGWQLHYACAYRWAENSFLSCSTFLAFCLEAKPPPTMKFSGESINDDSRWRDRHNVSSFSPLSCARGHLWCSLWWSSNLHPTHTNPISSHQHCYSRKKIAKGKKTWEVPFHRCESSERSSDGDDYGGSIVLLRRKMCWKQLLMTQTSLSPSRQE